MNFIIDRMINKKLRKREKEMIQILELNQEERMAHKRNYRKEYQDFHGKDDQKINRAKRNKARKISGLKVGDAREVDHKKPLSKGGSNGKKNLRIVSRTTNRKKGKS